MWFYLVNLILHSGRRFLVALGTTGLGWWVQGILWFFATEAATYLVLWAVRGKAAMKARFAENFRVGIYVWLIVMLFVYGPLFAWHVVKEVYADHLDLTAANKILETKNSALVDPKAKDNEIKDLKKQIEDLKKEGRTSHVSVTDQFPVSQEAHRCWLDSHFESPNPHTKESRSATTAIIHCIHCSYRIDAPFVVAVKFDRDFLYGNVGIPGSNYVIGGGSKQPGNVFLPKSDHRLSQPISL